MVSGMGRLGGVVVGGPMHTNLYHYFILANPVKYTFQFSKDWLIKRTVSLAEP